MRIANNAPGLTRLRIARAGLLAALVCAPATPAAPRSRTPQTSCVLNVAAASDLSDAMQEIAASFERQSGCAVRVSVGSSGNFLSQIENGAPFDVFFSADIEYPRRLEAAGLAPPGGTYLYAEGKLVVWTRNDSRLDVSKGFEALRDRAVRRIAIANPQHAPYGRAAQQALERAGIYDAVRARLVLGENISQAAQFAESGAADAGILALSLAMSPALQHAGKFWLIPETFYAPIQQGVVVIRRSRDPARARAFVEFIKQPATAALLQRYGFLLPSRNNR